MRTIKRRTAYRSKQEEIKQKQSEASKKLWSENYDKMCQAAKNSAPQRAEKLKTKM